MSLKRTRKCRSEQEKEQKKACREERRGRQPVTNEIAKERKAVRLSRLKCRESFSR